MRRLFSPARLLLALLCLAGHHLAAADPLQTRLGADILPYSSFVLLRQGGINPDNLLKLPQLTFAAELRPDLRVRYEDSLELVLRPRFSAGLEVADMADDWDAHTKRASFFWNDLYLLYRVRPELSFTYGLQSFLWGPAEFMNASNRLFHVSALQRNALFETRGRNLLKAGFSAGQNFSGVVLLELADNDETVFGHNETFDRKGVIKLELSGTRGDHYLGLVAGGGTTSKGWLGQYVNLQPFDGLMVYADMSEMIGSRAWYPVRIDDTAYVQMQQSRIDSDTIDVLGVFGARYTLPSGGDVALEYVLNTAGYTPDELRDALTAATDPSPYYAENLQAFLNNGLEVTGRHFLFLNARFINVLPNLDSILLLRYLFSLTDQSGQGFVYFEFETSRSSVFYTSLTLGHGAEDSLFGQLIGGSFLLGARYSW